MTVKELIKYLETLDGDMLVAYALHSEYHLMDNPLHLENPTQIMQHYPEVKDLQPPRADGWVHSRWNSRRNDPVLPTQKYLVFPGN